MGGDIAVLLQEWYFIEGWAMVPDKCSPGHFLDHYFHLHHCYWAPLPLPLLFNAHWSDYLGTGLSLQDLLSQGLA